MNEKQAILALDRQVVFLTRPNRAQQEQIASLSQTLALATEASRSTIDG